MFLSKKRDLEETFSFLQGSLKKKKLLDENNNVLISSLKIQTPKTKEENSGQLSNFEDEAVKILENISKSKENVFKIPVKRPQPIAIKNVQKEVTVAKMLIQEKQFFERMNHKNITKFLPFPAEADSLVKDPSYKDLKTLMEDTSFQFNRKDRINMMIGILEGLSYLHSFKIYHRDIQPQNIIVAKEDLSNIKIADFNSSVIVVNKIDTILDINVGSLIYRAPELLLKFNKYDEGIDIWGAGLIAAELNLKQPLFGECKTETELLNCIIYLMGIPSQSDKYPSRISGFLSPKVPDDMERSFICSMLHLNVKGRPKTSQLRNHKWLSSSF